MKCQLLLVMVLVIKVKAAPYMLDQQMQMKQVMTNQELEQSMMNLIAQQSMEQWILQNQYNSMQQQQMAMQPLQAQKNSLHGPVPMYFNQPQPLLMLMSNTMTKTKHQFEDPNDTDPANLKLGIGDEDTVVINADNESNIPEMEIIPQRALVVLPNGQRLFIGSIISAIPFLPFEVNVPDSISWIYNGIAGIIGGIGQRLPFRPTTEATAQQTQESMTSYQESMTQGSTIPQESEKPTQDSTVQLIQKLMARNRDVGMPILMLPLTQTVPIQVPIYKYKKI